MLVAKISTSGSGVSRFFKSIAGTLNDQGVKQVAGRAGANTTKGHLRKLDRGRPNKMGGRRSHFFSAAADSTFFAAVSDGVEIHIAHTGMAQRYYGGTITPVNARALAIPARPEAYGRLPRDPELPELFVRTWKGGSVAALAAKENGALRVYFWLVKSVTQEGDPSVLPSEKYLLNNAALAVNSYLTRKLLRKG
ncbi:MAG: hypothetical protein HQ559_15640 [Lentisphaerae bacterium]|nr:hypothetical protein [Lentisphaerota bacterium]